ncbi:hypothetical protein ACFTAO_11690 [Paenibacillus rhizoplanae]
MGYTTREARDVRREFLRMFMKLKTRLDQGRLALVMSVADLYFQPDRVQDEEIIKELMIQYPEEGEAIMELMPAWKRWGYEEGIAEGIEQGIEKGIEQGIEQGVEKKARRRLSASYCFTDSLRKRSPKRWSYR